MSPPRSEEILSREALWATVRAQRQEIARLTTQVAEQAVVNEQLRADLERLQAEIEELKRGSTGSAAPFSRGTHVERPKPPGRRKGEGPFTFRQAPPAETVTEQVAVPVEETTCPECGGELIEERVDLAFMTEVPAVARPIVREYRVSVCRCRACGRSVRGRHPDLAPDQRGATAHRLGPRLKAAAHALHYGVGVPVRKVPAVLQALSGVSVTQSALTQDALRHSEGPVGEAYRQLRAAVKESPQVNTDDTGWRIGGETAFLMAFETERASVYQIRRRHRNEEVREVVPGDYPGVMGCDRGPSYDAMPEVAQQKCLRHIDRTLVDEIEGRNAEDRAFPLQLKALLDEAQALWRAQRVGAIDRTAYERQGIALKGKVWAHLMKETARLHVKTHPDALRSETADAPRLTPPRAPELSAADRGNRRILEQVGRHHMEGNLLRFLDDPAIEPTNNRAERALRPAVIARKVSHCSKTDRGAEAFAAFVSVIRTLVKTGAATVAQLANVMRHGPAALPDPSPRASP